MTQLLTRGCLVFIGFVASLAANLTADDRSQAISDFALNSNYGHEVHLADFKDKPIVVLAFLGTECPLAKLYGPRLSELQTEFKD